MYSVIIPLYNKVNYIEKTVQSVLGQSFQDFELLIIDDGSTDNSLELVQQFSDDRIRTISQVNAGVSVTRNNGVEAARNEYIAFLDADDWWAPDYLEEMRGLISKYPDAGLWAAKYYKVKQGRNIEANIGLDENLNDGPINYFRVYAKTLWMPITSSSYIIKKTTFKAFQGYKPELKIGEDFDLWVRIALKHKITFLNKALVYYNQDVPVQNRAVGGQKIYHPQNHFIFRLNLDEEEKINNDLKILLDRLRLRSLLRYRLKAKYPEETRRVLDKIDFGQQPFSWRLKYKLPLWMVQAWFSIKLILSKAKTFIKKPLH